MLRAAEGFPPSLPLTSKIPITDAITPIAESKSGNTAAVSTENAPPERLAATVASVIAEII